jgi:BirA family biotin operon repressor/biotin-[acetyl-CoA-carboxylase] ligase
MKIVKLNATDSTNVYLKDLVNSQSLEDYTIVVADEQTKGRGQMGTKWQSEPFKNLTFSVLKKVKGLNIVNPFLLNICASLAVYYTLKKKFVPDLSIKWPNDILSGNNKLCGILIENIISGSQLKESIIGIGLNVNQTRFYNLSKVSSMKLVLGKTFDMDQLLKSFQIELKKIFLRLEDVGVKPLQKDYENVLFRKGKPSTFKDIEGKLIMGFIRGVSDEGRLQVTLEDEVKKEFDMKEVSLLY